MNTDNFGVATGRAVRDPKVFDNKDGSKKVMLTLAVKNNYKNRQTNERESQFIELEAFIPASRQGDLGPYAYIKQGFLVSVHYSVVSSQYEKNGQTHYTQTLNIQDVNLKEPKNSQVSQRAAAQAGQQQNMNVAQPQTPQQPVSQAGQNQQMQAPMNTPVQQYGQGQMQVPVGHGTPVGNNNDMPF